MLRIATRSLPLFVVATCIACASKTEKPAMWPKAWLESESEFGSLAIEYRLTDDCGINPNFEIVEYPNIEVTRDEIQSAMRWFLKRATQEDIPEEAWIVASLEVFGQETTPDRVLEKNEYDALRDSLERLGPWSQVRTLPLGGKTLRCTFDPTGTLIKVEKLSADKVEYSDFAEDLSAQGPYRLQWKIED